LINLIVPRKRPGQRRWKRSAAAQWNLTIMVTKPKGDFILMCKGYIAARVASRSVSLGGRKDSINLIIPLAVFVSFKYR
jgi:hypothetical protein